MNTISAFIFIKAAKDFKLPHKDATALTATLTQAMEKQESRLDMQ